MNKIKPLIILLIALCMACSKSQDQACVAPAVEKNIIGTWTIKVPTGSGKVTFNADGTLVDDAGIMVDGEINGVKTTKRTWSIANNKLTVNASAPGNGSIGFILNILDKPALARILRVRTIRFSPLGVV